MFYNFIYNEIKKIYGVLFVFKNASEIKKVAEKNLHESTPFQIGVNKISENVAKNIEKAASDGKFNTRASFENWYVDKHSKVIEAVIDDLKESGYEVSDLNTSDDIDYQFIKISWN